MGRPTSEFSSNLQHVERIFRFKGDFSDLVLFAMMLRTQAYGPAIGWFDADSPIGIISHVGALNGNLFTPRHRAVMTPHPGAMGRTLP